MGLLAPFGTAAPETGFNGVGAALFGDKGDFLQIKVRGINGPSGRH